MESLFRQLLLCPSDPLWQASDRPALLTLLRKLAIVGESVGDASLERFLIGDAFLQYFSFMGCAPSIEFEPSERAAIDWGEFVFMHLPPPFIQPKWLADTSAKPGCPSCSRRLRDWRLHLLEREAVLKCPNCGQHAAACDWRWYNDGACARQYIGVINVYPKEVMPTDALLQELQAETGTAWQYFYLHAPMLLQN